MTCLGHNTVLTSAGPRSRWTLNVLNSDPCDGVEIVSAGHDVVETAGEEPEVVEESCGSLCPKGVGH